MLPTKTEPRETGLTLPPEWRWRTQDSQMLRPQVMVTRHLHHTLVMIWHHTMPPEARVRPYYRNYSFDPDFYTQEYMLQAIHIMSRELAARHDLTPVFRRELRQMAEYLSRTSGEIGQARRLPGAR